MSELDPKWIPESYRRLTATYDGPNQPGFGDNILIDGYSRVWNDTNTGEIWYLTNNGGIYYKTLLSEHTSSNSSSSYSSDSSSSYSSDSSSSNSSSSNSSSSSLSNSSSSSYSSNSSSSYSSDSSSSSLSNSSSSSSSAIFSPVDIPSLAAWYDASDLTTITHSLGSVSQLDDKSGNLLHLTQAIASEQPTTGTQLINGLNVLDWGIGTNNNSLEYITGVNTDNWQDVFVVAVWDGGSTFTTFNGLITGNANDSNNVGILADPSTTNIYDPIRWWNLLNLNGTTISNPPWTVLPAVQSPSIFEVYATSPTSINGIKLGNDRLYPNRGWEGKIAEVVIFTEELSVLDRNNVYNYLNNKWIV